MRESGDVFKTTPLLKDHSVTLSDSNKIYSPMTFYLTFILYDLVLIITTKYLVRYYSPPILSSPLIILSHASPHTIDR